MNGDNRISITPLDMVKIANSGVEKKMDPDNIKWKKEAEVGNKTKVELRDWDGCITNHIIYLFLHLINKVYFSYLTCDQLRRCKLTDDFILKMYNLPVSSNFTKYILLLFAFFLITVETLYSVL